MKKFLQISFFAVILFGIVSVAHANPATVNLTVRDGGTIVFSGAVPLQPAGMISLNDSSSVSHSLNADSVLSVLNDADISSADFSISNLTYNNSYASFYLKCITDSVSSNCDNWQYTVNNSYPGVGMDKNVLTGGENVYVYFGPQFKVVLSSNSVTTADNLTVTSQEYNYQNNTWGIRTGVTVGLTQPDPNNPWTPIEVKTGAVDSNGQAVFSGIPVGSYNVGIQQDYYFPTESLTVTTPIINAGGPAFEDAVAPVNSIEQPVSKSIPIVKSVFDSQKGFDFLISQQKKNGSFDEDIYTDWTAIAFASNPNYLGQKVKKYLSENKLAGTLLTDYERRAMSLMSLGINPYDTQGENYIKKITDSFDGTQFGDVNEDNDDIFALIVLQNAGFIQDEKIIKDDVSFILSKQKVDGSWDESVDMTGAAMEAMAFYQDNGEMKIDLEKAKDFLKQNQKDTGGWADVSSTSWAMEGILALGEKPEDWIKNGNTPLDYIATMQDTDGGIKDLSVPGEGGSIKNRIWETAYTLTALSSETWNQTMQKFEKPQIISTLAINNTLVIPESIQNKSWLGAFLSKIFGF